MQGYLIFELVQPGIKSNAAAAAVRYGLTDNGITSTSTVRCHDNGAGCRVELRGWMFVGRPLALVEARDAWQIDQDRGAAGLLELHWRRLRGRQANCRIEALCELSGWTCVLCVHVEAETLVPFWEIRAGRPDGFNVTTSL
ncbi:hypothetical protein EYF80_006974 [Liparis tanakae]|uniref:Uncharacterized protein n=1 Tax=Liparis tanakae TaxID=230148 RepID=A0A4Z2IZW4_9TELE|nr:hypothetical protein EYF80_006974 [Liparis tanakae]